MIAKRAIYSVVRPLRCLSSSCYPSIKISPEVQQALNENVPIVALESTIITHGLPYPANVEMAKSVESLVRLHHAVPATIGFIKGMPTVGLQPEDLYSLSAPDNVGIPNKVKISHRDIPSVMSSGLTGGTTIAATMMLAHRANIDVFATGGLGGVSRPWQLMDISADLDELSKTPVAVVCSGPKSILDVKKTMEYLETKGVPVSTYIDNDMKKVIKNGNVNVPGFYTRDSGVKSPFSWNNVDMAASMIYEGKYNMKMENGYVFCVPAPVGIALPGDVINKIIEETLVEATERGIEGKDLTPFMLGRINDRTGGVSVKCNVEFVKNNVIVGSQIANKLVDLKGGKKNFYQPVSQHNFSGEKSSKVSIEKPLEYVNSAIIGSVALDTTCKVSKKNFKLQDSNPGQIAASTIGGVGFNVLLAAQGADMRNSILLISAVNKNDFAGRTILSTMNQLDIGQDGMLDIPGETTAQYISMHDPDGKLIVACADMNIIEKIPDIHVTSMLEKYKPKYVLFDTNISVSMMDTILSKMDRMKIIIEPTSGVKCAKLGELSLRCFPQAQVELITPTIEELDSIYRSFVDNGRFEDIDTWFSCLDAIGSGSALREKLNWASNSNALIKKYLEKGVFQQAFQLLPYFPTMLIKDGSNGIMLIQITESATRDQGLVSLQSTNFINKETMSDFTIVGDRGRHDLGIVIQHFPAIDIPQESIRNVTGAGDSLVGYILGKLSREDEGNYGTILHDLDSTKREELMMGAQKASCLSLLVDDAVNFKGIRNSEINASI